VSLVCYADETGTHDISGKQPGSEVAGVAGYLSRKEDWPVIEYLWQETLDSFGVSAFHMREFVAGKRESQNPAWPYSGWDQTNKDDFIEALAVTMRTRALPFGAMLYVEDYDRLLSPEFKAYYKHPYHFCFQLFLAVICHGLDDYPGKPFWPGEEIAFFFDQQQQFASEAIKIFCQLKQHGDPNGRFGSIAFVDKRKFIPLQAADLLAFRLRKIETRAKDGRKLITEGSWDDALLLNETAHVMYYGPHELKSIQALFDAGEWYKPDGTKITNL